MSYNCLHYILYLECITHLITLTCLPYNDYVITNIIKIKKYIIIVNIINMNQKYIIKYNHITFDIIFLFKGELIGLII